MVSVHTIYGSCAQDVCALSNGMNPRTSHKGVTPWWRLSMPVAKPLVAKFFKFFTSRTARLKTTRPRLRPWYWTCLGCRAGPSRPSRYSTRSYPNLSLNFWLGRTFLLFGQRQYQIIAAVSLPIGLTSSEKLNQVFQNLSFSCVQRRIGDKNYLHIMVGKCSKRINFILPYSEATLIKNSQNHFLSKRLCVVCLCAHHLSICENLQISHVFLYSQNFVKSSRGEIFVEGIPITLLIRNIDC